MSTKKKIHWRDCTKENNIQVTNETVYSLRNYPASSKAKAASTGRRFVLKLKGEIGSGLPNDGKIYYPQGEKSENSNQLIFPT